MGVFDDLIPQENREPATPVAASNPFEDLIPKVPQSEAGYPTANNKVDVLKSPDFLDYPLEAIKGVASGAKNLFASAMQGIAATSTGPSLTGNLPGGIATDLEQAPSPEMEAIRRSVAQQPLEVNPLFRAGQAVEQFGKEKLSPDPAFVKNSPVRQGFVDVASGVGSLGAGLATAVVGGPGLSAATFIGAGQGEAVQNARQANATTEQQRTAAKLGSVAGATDLADLLLLNLGSAGKAAGLIKKVGLTALSAAMEGGQEGFQQYIQNLISKGVYDPNKDVTEGVAYNALIGGIVGGAANPVLAKLSPGEDKAPTDQTVRDVFDGMTGPLEPPAQTTPVVATTPPQPNVPTPPDWFETDTPPFPEPPAIDTPSAGPINIDMGFELSITRTKPQDPYTLVNDEDKIIASDHDFSVLAKKTKGYLDTGELPTETPPNPTTDLPKDIADFLAKKVPKLTADIPQQEVGTTELSTSPMREERDTTPGVNTGRLAKLLGPKLYGTPEDLPAVTVKELFQNGFDAVKGAIERGSLTKGDMRITTNRDNRTITFYDNGTGMSPEVLGKQFLEIAGTHKESERASGGLGIAKMLTLFGNKGLRVLTMREGKVARLVTSGDELFAALDDKSKSPKIQYSAPTAQELAMFPDGHGTVVSVTVPHNYVDPESGEKKSIYFPAKADDFPVLTNSPLLGNIQVTFNGAPIENMGTTFSVDEYTNLFNVKFGWGNARFYVSKGPANERYPYGDNTHVLSNGLWQFSTGIKQDPSQSYGPNVTRQFYVDLAPTVRPEDAGYPFDLNRQKFTATANRDVEKIFHYISLLYRHEDLRTSATNFGEIYYLSDGGTTKSGSVKIEPKKPSENPTTLIREGDKVSVVDGQIVVNGREVPTLNPRDIKNMTPDANELKVDQKEIDPNKVMVHDNTIVKLSDTESKSITTLALEKFGTRFDSFMHELGDAFMRVRDAVADKEGYSGLHNEAIGLSFDKSYRGVSIRVPFSGSFINPALPEVAAPLLGGLGMYYTMIHELAHHTYRSEDGLGPQIQALAGWLDAHPTFDAHATKQRIVGAVARNKDIFEYINGFYSGAFDIGTRGKRFSTNGANEARAIGGPGAGASTSGAGRGREVSKPTGRSTSRSLQSAFGSGHGRRVEETRGTGPLREQLRNTSILHGIDPGLEATFSQEELGPLKQAVAAATSGVGGANSSVSQLGIHADRMNKLYKWLWGLDRLVDKNPRFTPLLRYAERIREARLDTSKIHDAGLRIAKAWRNLGSRAEPLAALLDDMANMRYRTPAEISKGVRRMPTKDEFDTLVTTHKVDAAALAVFDKQRKFFSTFLDLVTQNAKDTAVRTIQDPVALAAKLDQIVAQQTNLAKAPYFPFTRFGSHFLTVRDAAGNVTFFETYERKGVISAERVQQKAKAELQKALPQGSTITEGVLPETAAPFVGLPPELLESISRELNLTRDQQDALDQIRYQFAPAASFVHHYQQKSYTPGYSHDFLRAFSRYAFHGARYYSRVKYAWALRDEIKAARSVGGNKAGAIANYMEDHLQNAVLDAKGDFGVFKGAIFLWVFGYSPAGAAINLSQVPMITYPFLAAKFGGIGIGDARATKALVKAMTNVGNFYKKGAYDNATEFENRALDYGIKSGRISEAMASELAGLAQGQNLLGLGKGKAARGFQLFLEKAASMFELSEQFNRRVTYRATLDLAMAYPNSLGVKEALNKYSDEYQQLLGKNFNPQEAAAIVAASHATEQTQFVYARETRPRAFRGKLAGTILVFKTYMLNVLQLMGANKTSVLPRYMLMMLLLGGLMGLPGGQDLADIANIIGRWFFGKDFNVKLALRQLILDIAHERIPPDLVLHGFARKGFGVPALMDLMGEHPGRGLGGAPNTLETKANYEAWANVLRMKGSIPGSYEEFRKQHSQNVPMPSVDMSNALGMGRILPFDLGKVVNPTNDPSAAIAGTAQQASGAIFSVGFNLYKALQDAKTPSSDWKRWEKTMPRAMASASRAYRAYSEGRERSRGGPAGAATVVNYDSRDPEQAAEILAMAAGFMPTRQSAQWDSIAAQSEVIAKFKFEKDLLMSQMFEAQAAKSSEEISRVRKAIVDYNSNLPQWAKSESITGKGLSSSLQERFKTKAYREAGVPRKRAEVPIARHVQGLFPESVVDVRRIPQE